jgi:hypothetical protein
MMKKRCKYHTLIVKNKKSRASGVGQKREKESGGGLEGDLSNNVCKGFALAEPVLDIATKTATHTPSSFASSFALGTVA